MGWQRRWSSEETMHRLLSSSCFWRREGQSMRVCSQQSTFFLVLYVQYFGHRDAWTRALSIETWCMALYYDTVMCTWLITVHTCAPWMHHDTKLRVEKSLICSLNATVRRVFISLSHFYKCYNLLTTIILYLFPLLLSTKFRRHSTISHPIN